MSDVDTADNIISLNDLAEKITAVLSETDYKTLVMYAGRYYIEYDSADHIVDAINQMLLDPYTGSSTIIDLANEVIEDKSFAYEGDSLVSVAERAPSPQMSA